MSKLSTPLLIVLAITAVVGIGGWRSAAGKLSTASTDLTVTSNKLAEVTAKLAEQGATTETLRTQLALQKSDVAAATEKITLVTSQLNERVARLHGLEAEVARRDGQIALLNRTNGQQQAEAAVLAGRIGELEAALEQARQQIAEVNNRWEVTRAALNETEAGRAVLLVKWNDPSVLRAQLKTVAMTPEARRAAAEAKLQLDAAGNVVVIEPDRPKSKQAEPVFSDPPPDNPNAPKIILTY